MVDQGSIPCMASMNIQTFREISHLDTTVYVGFTSSPESADLKINLISYSSCAFFDFHKFFEYDSRDSKLTNFILQRLDTSYCKNLYGNSFPSIELFYRHYTSQVLDLISEYEKLEKKLDELKVLLEGHVI